MVEFKSKIIWIQAENLGMEQYGFLLVLQKLCNRPQKLIISLMMKCWKWKTSVSPILKNLMVQKHQGKKFLTVLTSMAHCSSEKEKTITLLRNTRLCSLTVPGNNAGVRSVKQQGLMWLFSEDQIVISVEDYTTHGFSIISFFIEEKN